MSTSPIRRFRILSEEPDFWSDTSPAQRKSRDPSRLAAAAMLQLALDDVGLSVTEAARDGVVMLVTLPDACWREPILEEWRTFARRGEWHRLSRRDRLHNPDMVSHVFAPEEPPTRREQDDAKNEVAKAIADGEHVLGIAVDVAMLPADLVHAADLRLSLSCPSATDISMVVAEMCDEEPNLALTEKQATSLTPRLLRLARRADQTSDQYIRKLVALLDAEPKLATSAASTATHSPRVEPTLDRLHGMQEAVAWGLQLARDIQSYRLGKIGWGDVDRGCLLSGAPGTGKTLFARALAATCEAPLVTGSYGEWLGQGGGHQGDLLRGIRKAFAVARTKVPSILFIDEIDSFPNRSTVSAHHAEWETQVVNALLAEIDGVQNREGVVLIGACNHPNKLDPALIRSGRLDRHIRIGLPDQADLKQILREHLGDDLPGDSLALAALNAIGASGADCERFVREARRRARDAGRAIVAQDLMEAIGGEDHRTLDDLWMAAIHEAGHAVASYVLEPGVLQAVSIRQSGVSGGRQMGNFSRGYIRLSDIRTNLLVGLAGRAAEETVFGEASSGAGGSSASDIAQATWIAMLAVSSLGLDPVSGLLWVGMPDPTDVSTMLADNPMLAVRVRNMLDEAYRKALMLVVEQRPAVEVVAQALLKCRALDGDAVAALVKGHRVGGSNRIRASRLHREEIA